MIRSQDRVRVFARPDDATFIATGRIDLVRLASYRSACASVAFGRATFVRVADNDTFSVIDGLVPPGVAGSRGYGILSFAPIDGITAAARAQRRADIAPRRHSGTRHVALQMLRVAMRDVLPGGTSCHTSGRRRDWRG